MIDPIGVAEAVGRIDIAKIGTGGTGVRGQEWCIWNPFDISSGASKAL